MHKSKQRYLLVCLGLILLLTQSLWGQFVIKVNGTDGSGITDTLTLAVDAAGTASYDSLSPTLREYEIPVPAKGLDFRVAPYSPADSIGAGSYTSIHHMALPTQSDTWKLQFNVDSGRTSFLLQWPAGLGSVGGHYWKLKADPFDVISFPDVDMTSSTSLSIPVSDIESHTFYIVTGDAQMYRSVTSSEIANASDFKFKKGKSEKRKPYGSEGTFTWTNDLTAPTTRYMTDLHIEWSQAIDQATFSISPAGGTQTWDPKFTKFSYKFGPTPADSLPPSGVVTIFARGNKGKALQAKKWYWTINDVMYPPKVKNPPKDPGTSRLLLHMPNINNMGEEAYSQIVFGTNGVTIGDPVNKSGVNAKGKDVFKAVIHPKWSGLLKTLSDKTGLQTGPAKCLDNFLTAKPIEKTQKSLPPGKHNNILLGDAVALKVNIGFGIAGKIEEGGTAFGDLQYVRQTGDPPGVPNGASVHQIADSLDRVLQCLPPAWGGTFAEWDAMVSRINSAFSGPFDTVSFGQSVPPPHFKQAGTVAKGVKPLAEVPYLYRASFADMLPTIKAPDISALEARNQPAEYKLMQNYPNPFNPLTNIEFSLPEEGFVTMKVYNLLGQEVATLINNELMDEGTNEVAFDATSFASGVYYYRLIVNDGQFTFVKKMMLIK